MADDGRIAAGDVEAAGDVDGALGTYYADSVARVADQAGIPAHASDMAVCG